MKLLVLGLDGATWDVLDPLIERGKLPNLGRLRDEGSTGALRTCDPPYTFPAWKVISSGRPPAELGVHGWITVDFERRGRTVPDARTFNTPDVWDYLANEGLAVASVNMPATWPVRPIGKRGVMVGDPFARSDIVVEPPEAVQRYRLGPYTTDAPLAFRESPEKALELLRTLEGERFDISERLAPHMDVLFHTVFFCDPVQHFHWHDPATIEAAWTWLDARIGELIESCGAEHIVVVSDHGFAEIEHQFNVNRWLEDEGLLVTEGTASTPWLYRLGLTRERALAVGQRLGLDEDTMAKLVPLTLRRAVPNKDGELSVNRWSLIDWERTRALSADGFQLFVRDDEARARVLDGLRGLTVPGTDVPVFERVTDAAASGATDAPVVLTPRDGVHLAHKFAGELWKRSDFSAGWQATHALDGIVAIHGPEAPTGSIDGARLVDIAPSILALTGCKVPSSMTGAVLAGKSAGARDTLPPPFG